MKRRRFATAAGAILIAAGIQGQGIYAFGAEGTSDVDQAFTLLEEIAQVGSCAIKYTMVTEADGINSTINVEVQKSADGIGNVNIQVTANGEDGTAVFSGELEDLFRAQCDACYLNAGEILNTISEASGMASDVQPMAELVGLNEDWVRIPYGELSALACDDMAVLVKDIRDKLYTAENLPLTAEAINGGYRLTMDLDSCVSNMDSMFNVLEENLEGWLDDGIAILKTVDIFSYAQTYVDAALEGIHSADPEFDDSGIIQTIDLLRMQYADFLDTCNGAAVMESLQSEGFDFDIAAQQMQNEWAQAGAAATMSYTVVKNEDGSYGYLAGFAVPGLWDPDIGHGSGIIWPYTTISLYQRGTMSGISGIVPLILCQPDAFSIPSIYAIIRHKSLPSRPSASLLARRSLFFPFSAFFPFFLFLFFSILFPLSSLFPFYNFNSGQFSFSFLFLFFLSIATAIFKSKRNIKPKKQKIKEKIQQGKQHVIYGR